MRWIGRTRLCLKGLHCAGHESRQFEPSIRRAPTRTKSYQTARSVRPSRSFTRAPARQTPDSSRPTVLTSRISGWTLFGLVLGGAALAVFALRKPGANDDGDVINHSTFSPFTITSKEQVSPTTFILTIRPGNSSSKDDAPPTSPRIQEAWKHGLWSVEIKQPQLQIARHYTPLPPPAADGTDVEQAAHGTHTTELRFLIRRMDGGEMSSYLSKRRVGDQVWLRGPHLGFDVARRLGGARDVVFLAGGTGVAPALQVAHKLLDGSLGGDGEGRGEGPSVSVLWANRKGVDALGRRSVPVKKGWFGFGAGPETRVSEDEEVRSSLARQIREMETRHGTRFDMSYFVDEEKSFIGSKDMDGVVARARASTGTLVPATKTCPWHSAAAVAKLPNDNDAGRALVMDCTCKRAAPSDHVGANLLLVSGPDGFIEAYAGPKRWHEGGEMQGTVRGILGQMMNDAAQMENWLVLKL